MKKVFYGWTGELGWEIVTALPIVNWLSQNYDEVVVCTFPDVFGLYKDMDVKLIDSGLSPDERVSGKGREGHLTIPKGYEDYIIAIPGDKGRSTIGRTKSIPKPIREDIKVEKTDTITIHARNFPSARKKTGRNWQPQYDMSLELLRSFGFSLVFVGHPDYSIAIEEYGEDRRSDNVEDMIRDVKASRLFFGPDSGPTHIAQWVLTPAYSWGCGDCRNFVSDGRANAVWNPFRTPHFHPWHHNPTEENLLKYRKQSYRPTEEEFKTSIVEMMKVTNNLRDFG